MLSVSGGLASNSTDDLARVLTSLYVSQPLRWQTFMDEAQVLIDAIGDERSGFPETVAPGDG